MTGSPSDYSVIWFSHNENKYDAELKLFQKVFNWTKESQLWDWNNCKITWIKKSESELRIVIRSHKIVKSKFRKKEVKVKYMLGFDVKLDAIQPPEEEPYREPLQNTEKKYGQLRRRWVIRLNKNYYIWQWTSNKNGYTLENSEVFRIYKNLKRSFQQHITNIKKNVFLVEDICENNRIIPVIYQAAIDSWKNFVREVHSCKIDENVYEVTILFENEHLRNHHRLDKIYRMVRYLVYGRVTDIESFKIIMNKGIPAKFQFKDIFSGEHTIEDDNVHGDKPHWGKIPTHDIKYYFNDENHPIVFVNTANHALSYHDTNHKIWKWEYIPWEKDSAIIYGEKSRSELDRRWWSIKLF